MSISKHNKGSRVDWGFSTEGLDFIKLSELKEGTIYKLGGMFVTPDTGFGEGAVLIMKDEVSGMALVNIPSRHLDSILEILQDPETIEQIKAGRAGFKYAKFISKKYHREGYSVEFVDL